jgi:hypothetical protein
MSTTDTNGRQRKSLAEQIDRLDAILDGLSDALQGAVAQAVQEAVGLAVKEAVRAVLTEILTNPQVQEKLRGPVGPPPPPAAGPKPAATPGSRLRERLHHLGRKSRALGQWAGTRLLALWRRLVAARRLVIPLVALGIGTLVAVAGQLGGWPVGPAAAWLVGFARGLVSRARFRLGQAGNFPGDLA